MAQKKEIKVIVGEEISPEEAKKLDPAKRGVITVRKPSEADVTGQYVYTAYTQCPWCESIGWGDLDTKRYTWFICGTCGRPFRVQG